MPGPWSDAEVATMERLAADGLTDPEIAARMPGRSTKAIERARSRYGVTAGSKQDRASPPGRRTLDDAVHEIAGKKAPEYPEVSLSGADLERIESLDDLVERFGADPSEWHIEQWWPRGGSWDMQLGDGKVGQGHSYRISAHLKRKPTLELEERQESFQRFIEEHAPTYPDYPDPEPSDDPHLLELDFFDVHVGKLAWGPEVDGSHYDSKVARDSVMEALDKLLRRARGYDIERILIPLGNDLFHTDTPEGTTTAGTRQDVDSRPALMSIRVEELAISVIDRAAQLAPVKVIIVPGNHDEHNAFTLGRVLNAWYRKTDRVEVDCSPALRKFERYGVNLIGFTHGKDEKPDALPLLMATERPQDWAETVFRTWHIGHIHKKKETRYTVGDTFNGVEVRVIQSLSDIDFWHYRKGYTKGRRAAESFLWSKHEGPGGQIPAFVGMVNPERRIAA